MSSTLRFFSFSQCFDPFSSPFCVNYRKLHQSCLLIVAKIILSSSSCLLFVPSTSKGCRSVCYFLLAEELYHIKMRYNTTFGVSPSSFPEGTCRKDRDHSREASSRVFYIRNRGSGSGACSKRALPQYEPCKLPRSL